jgi:hypothetical protein
MAQVLLAAVEKVPREAIMRSGFWLFFKRGGTAGREFAQART